MRYTFKVLILLGGLLLAMPVVAQLAITQQPTAQTVQVGATATFTSATNCPVSGQRTAYYINGAQHFGPQLTSGTWTYTTPAVTAANNGNTYQFEFYSCPNEAGDLKTAVVTLTVTAAPVTPVAPTGLVATATSSSAINVVWQASTGATTYSVFRSTVSGFTPSTTNELTTGVAATLFSDSGLSPSTTYYYVVEAVSTSGSTSTASAPSAQVNATTQAAAGPVPDVTGQFNFPGFFINWDWTVELAQATAQTTTIQICLAGSTAQCITIPGSGTTRLDFSINGVAVGYISIPGMPTLAMGTSTTGAPQ